MAESQRLQEYVRHGMHVPFGAAQAVTPCAPEGWIVPSDRPSEPGWALSAHLSAVVNFRRCMANQPTIESKARAMLSHLKGVDAAYLTGAGDERTVLVVAREHGIVDMGALIDIEDLLIKEFGWVEITVRAHQGRGLAQYEHLKKIL